MPYDLGVNYRELYARASGGQNVSRRRHSASNPRKKDNCDLELQEKDADKVVGGVSIPYGQIQWQYTQQKPTGDPPR